MSTPNPTRIIADHWYMYIPVAGVTNIECDCGKFRTAGPYSIDEMRELHAAHVVSKLTDAGYRIVPEGWRPPARVYEDAADVPVRAVIWWPADKTVAARFDNARGVVLGDDRPFPWSLITGPVTVLFEEPAATQEDQ